MLDKISQAKSLLAFGVAVIFLSACTPKENKEHSHSLLEACSKECPLAKSGEAALACAISKEKDPEFQKTSCGMAKAEHDKKMGKSSKASSGIEETLNLQEK